MSLHHLKLPVTKIRLMGKPWPRQTPKTAGALEQARTGLEWDPRATKVLCVVKVCHNVLLYILRSDDVVFFKIRYVYAPCPSTFIYSP